MLTHEPPPSQQEDGSFVFALPVPATSKFSLINCAGDYGAYVRGAIESDAPVGSEILACAEEIDMQTVVDTWAQGECTRDYAVCVLVLVSVAEKNGVRLVTT